jgi:hypothetical protein
MMDIDTSDPDPIDQPRVKRRKQTGTLPPDPLDPQLSLTIDVSIHKRALIHSSSTDSSVQTSQTSPRDEDPGPCIYLSRHSVLPYIAERIEKELQNGKNSTYPPRNHLACVAEVYSRNGVTIRAMGAAIEKAVRLAVELQRRNYSLGIVTGTAEVVDDVIPDNNVLLSPVPVEWGD